MLQDVSIASRVAQLEPKDSTNAPSTSSLAVRRLGPPPLPGRPTRLSGFGVAPGLSLAGTW